MALKTKVIANINSLTEARYFAAMGADWLSFYLDPVFPASFELEEAKKIIEWVSGPKIMGAFNGMPIPEIQEIARELNLDGLAMGPTYEPHEITDSDKDLFWHLMREDPRAVETGLMDFGDTQWEHIPENTLSLLKEIASNTKLYLQINVKPEQVLSMIETIGLEGIILGGDDEEKVGMQSFEEADQFMDLLQLEA